MRRERDGIEIISEKDLGKIKNEAERRVARGLLNEGFRVKSQVYAGKHPIDFEVTDPGDPAGGSFFVEVTVSERVRALGRGNKQRQFAAAHKAGKEVILITREDLPDYK